MGKSQRRKGAEFERALVRLFRAEGLPARRGLQYREGAECPDVLVADQLHVEAKHGIKPGPRAALAQAQGDVAKGRWACAVIKDNQEKPFERTTPFVVMGLEDFVDLLTEWWETR